MVDVKNSDDSGEFEIKISPAYAEILGRRSSLAIVFDAAMVFEGTRVSAQVRLKHLARRNATCLDTRELLERVEALEKWADERLVQRVKNHPTYHWVSRIKGTGGEAIGKVLGHVEAFGRFYPVGDTMIPNYVNREAILVPVPKNGNNDDGDEEKEFEERPMIWVEGIERLATVSKFYKYAGLIPGQKRESGQLSSFNVELRTMLWRLGVSLMRSSGKYYEFYNNYKSRLEARLATEGKIIKSTPKGRMCPQCKQEVEMKAARFCPVCGTKLTLKEEPEGVIWKGHVHNMCVRRMVKLFCSHLWVVWREALNLPIRDPYPIEYLGHTTIIRPWDMADR